jgi:two-component system CheB/CheR fusion protein
MAARSSKRKSRKPARKSSRRRAASPRPPAASTTISPATCPVVALGASAGGLEAFEIFFRRMPPDSGIGFVLVPHLDARHKSAMTELVQRYTRMNVVEITDGMPVIPDRVHIIPPNAGLSIHGGHFAVVTPREEPMTIDPFLKSLAEDQGDNAVAVILSGTGSDGALGVKAIKEHGGVAMAQTGRSLRYDSMPHSAVATGLIDFELPVEDMPAKLVEYASHLRQSQGGREADNFRTEARRHLAKIYMLLRSKTGHDFSRYKDSTFLRRLQRRMQITQIAKVAAYASLLRKDPREINLLFRELLIGVTHFFRDPRAFEVLDKEVIAKLVAGNKADGVIRVWVAGCSTGEEAYSIAVLLRERLAQSAAPPKAQIFATDIDDHALDIARAGRYSEAIAQDISPERLERFFIRDGNTYRVAKELREMCIFSVHNVISDAPFSRLDLVACRNLLIYLDQSLQNRVIPLFHFALQQGGYLFLGPSENVTHQSKLFTKVDARFRIFKARPARLERPALEFGISAGSHRNPAALQKATAASSEETVSRRAMRVMETYAPAYIVVDDRHEVLHFAGRTGKYLQPTPGTATLDIFSILETSLRPDVRTALHRAAATGQRAVQENAYLMANGNAQPVNIIVEPIPAAENGQHYFVVAFQELGGVRAREPGTPQPTDDGARNETIANLEGELLATRERLQATIEELETSNEEMKASNEEFQAVNEELQSSNEELETSKEELQSVNEELETVNSELNMKIENLERAMNDRKNLLESTQIATIFLDSELRIKSFTPAITDIFHLIDSDYGRPVTHITSRLAYGDLEHDVRRVLRTLTRAEQEVALADGSAVYMMRILPYRTVDNVIDGVVITFIDLTELKRGAAGLARLAAIVENSQDAIIGMAPDGTITNWNAGAERIYGHRAAEAVGRPLSLVMPAERANELHAIVERLKRSRIAALTETERVAKDSRHLKVLSSVSPVRDSGGKLVAASVIEHDITGRKHAEEHQKMLLAELNHRVKNALAAVQSIAARSLRNSASLEEFRVTFEGRLQALAKAHDLLAASRWQGADLGDIVLTELAPYGEPERVQVRGDKFMLTSNASLILGMAFHELAVNAVKHGAFSGDQGRLEVSWDKTADGRLVVQWIEQSGPAIKPGPRKSGFGLKLIERGVREDLQGKVTVAFPKTGLRCVLDIPIAEAQESPAGTE